MDYYTRSDDGYFQNMNNNIEYILNQSSNISLETIKQVVSKFSYVVSVMHLHSRKIVWAIGRKECKTLIDTYFERDILKVENNVIENADTLTFLFQNLFTYPDKRFNVILYANLFDLFTSKIFNTSIRLKTADNYSDLALNVSVDISRILNDPAIKKTASQPNLSHFNLMELDIIKYLKLAKSDLEISKEISRSVETVRFHRKKIAKTLNAKNKMDLVRILNS